MKLVICGLGSIGKRHKNNLESLGHSVIDCHRDDKLAEILARNQVDGVLVCNPTFLHLPMAKIAITNHKPTFIEKPLSPNLTGVDKLIELAETNQLPVLIGYCLRFDTQLKRLKQQLTSLASEQIRSVTIVCKGWLPDWRPNSDYRQSYSAKKSLGGGVLLDLSHEIDYALWFFGPVKSVKAKLQMVPELEIETEAIADLILEFKSGVCANIYLSYASRKYERFCKIKTVNQTLRWDFQPDNEMYVKEMKHFIQVISGKEKPLVTLAEARHVLEIITAAKKSHKEGKIIKL